MIKTNLVEAQALDYCLKYLKEIEESRSPEFKEESMSFVWQAHSQLFTGDFIKTDHLSRVLTDFRIDDIEISQNFISPSHDDPSFITRIRKDVFPKICYTNLAALLKNKEALFQFLTGFLNDEKETLTNYSSVSSKIYKLQILGNSEILDFYQLQDLDNFQVKPVSLVSKN